MKFGLCFAFSCMGICLSQAGQDFFELPPIKYSETASDDAVVRLAGEIERGDWVVGPMDGKAFLKAVLQKLEILEESQVLVFSKTSITECAH